MGTALITGASAGLGAEYAKLFAADKHDLVLVARRKDRLDALAGELRSAHGVKVEVVPADLATPADRVVEEVARLGVQIEFLVNNAGSGASGAFAELELERELEMIQLNMTSLVVLTRSFLPAMIARRSGRVLNIGSTAGFPPGPFMAVYYASKAFVNSFTEALWYELKGTGVSATVSCPGATATEFAEVAGNSRSLLFRLGAANPKVVAAQGYRAMMKGKPMVIHGLKNKLTVQSLRISPRAVARAIAASLNPSPGRSNR
ncbi:MAG: SDR family oxidoreductase [Deltaproteobacteria bacterium]|nr:MAG: SDR family oxidoreductase [Deltaproteobacteria bacterium]